MPPASAARTLLPPPPSPDPAQDGFPVRADGDIDPVSSEFGTPSSEEGWGAVLVLPTETSGGRVSGPPEAPELGGHSTHPSGVRTLVRTLSGKGWPPQGSNTPAKGRIARDLQLLMEANQTAVKSETAVPGPRWAAGWTLPGPPANGVRGLHGAGGGGPEPGALSWHGWPSASFQP